MMAETRTRIFQLASIAIAFFVATSLLAESAERYPGAKELTLFDFGPGIEGEFSRPEGWTRLESDEYPFYVPVEMTKEQSATGGRSLRFQLNGGNCAIFSPTVEAAHGYNYVVRGQIRTDGVQNDLAYLLLEFLDAEGNLLDRQWFSQAVGGTKDWTMVQIGPLSPANPNVRFLRVGCVTMAGSPADLSGRVYFDDIWIGRLPRFEIETSGAFRIFEPDESKGITLRLRGFDQRDLNVAFTLFDHANQILAEYVQLLEPNVDQAVIHWTLPLDEVGYYPLDISIYEKDRLLLRRRFPVTVLRRVSPDGRSEFGLSLPSAPLGLDHYERILGYSATRWVRLPFWPAAPAPSLLGDRAFAEFLERISRYGHRIVGSLDYPPQEILEQLPGENIRIADVFCLPKSVWGPSLEATLVRFGLKVTDWQLGSDDDLSFCGLSDVDVCLANVREEIFRVGRDVQLGVSWDWFTPPPAAGLVDFLAVGDEIPETIASAESPEFSALAADELGFQIEALRRLTRGADDPLDASPDARGPGLWVNLSPLAVDRYDREARVIDLAKRVVAAKVAKSDALFAVDVFDPNRGLLDSSGSPTELFTIWRNLAEHLGGLESVGTLPVSGDAETYLFVGNGRASIVAWSDRPTEMIAVLGRRARVVDLWGRVVQGPSDDETRTVVVDTTPILIVDVDEFLARFQLAVAFERGAVSSRFGNHTDKLILQNPGEVPIAGSVVVGFPKTWSPKPERFPIQLGPGEISLSPFALTMPQGVPQGIYPIPMDFEIGGQTSYRFRLYRPFRVGGDEVKVIISTRLTPTDDILVEAIVTNLTDRLMSLSGSARTLGRKAEIDFVSNLRPGATTTSRYVFRDGRALIGRPMQVKFEDMNGRREFTFDVVVKP